MTAWPLTRHGPAGGPRAYKINISAEAAHTTGRVARA
jgi:hypothetical protein